LVLAAIATGQMIAGWIGQGAYYGVLAVGIYIGYRSLLSRNGYRIVRDRLRWLILSGLALAIIGGATAAPAVLPPLDAVSRSNRADLYEAETSAGDTGWEIKAVPAMIFSGAPGTQRWYLGATLITAAVLGTVVCWRRRHVPYFALLGVGVIALIIRGSPLKPVFNVLPRFEDLHIHAPDRIFVALFLAPAVLAGWLVDTMWNATSRRSLPWIRTLVATVVSIGLIGAAREIVHREAHYEIPDRRLLPLLLVILAVVIATFVRSRTVRQISAALIVALLVLDPAGELAWERTSSGRRVEMRAEIVDGILETSGAARWLQERRDAGEVFRFFGYDQVKLMNDGAIRTYHVSYSGPKAQRLLVNNRGVRAELEDVQGYNPVQITRYVDYFEAINGTGQSYHASNVLAGGLESPLLDLLNILYIVVPAEVPPGRPDLLWLSQTYPSVYRDNDVRILQRTTALPRAWIVHEAEQEEMSEDILALLSLRLVDPRETVLTEVDPPELVEPPDLTAESVTITERKPDEIHLEVTATARGMLVLSEVWDPGWSATVDGTSAEVMRVNHLLRGIVIEPGRHYIVVKYQATLAKRALFIYVIPIAALGLIPLVPALRRWMSVRQRP
jgi:hypothetical protein